MAKKPQKENGWIFLAYTKMTNKYPRLRTHTRKGKAGQVWTWWTYDQRSHGPEISLGSNYTKALEQWNLLHKKKPLTLGRIQEAIDNPPPQGVPVRFRPRAPLKQWFLCYLF